MSLAWGLALIPGLSGIEMRNKSWLFFAGLLFAATEVAAQEAIHNIRVMATTGSQVAGGVGTIRSFAKTIMARPGEAAAFCIVDLPAAQQRDRILRLGPGSGQGTIVLTEGDVSPDGNGTFPVPSDFAVNSLGVATFFTALNASQNQSVIALGAAVPLLSLVARQGQPTGIGFNFGQMIMTPSLSDAGHTVFQDVISVPVQRRTLWRRNANGVVTKIVSAGDAAPGSGTFFEFNSPQVNARGDVLFEARLSDNARAIFVAYATGAMEQVARYGQPSPSNNGTYSTFWDYRINGLGDVAIFASFSNTINFFDDQALVRWRDGAAVELVRARDPAPDGGLFNTLQLSSGIRFNDLNDVLFMATVSGDGSGSLPSVFLARNGEIISLARAQFNGVQEALSLVAINNGGLSVFTARYSRGAEIPTTTILAHDGISRQIVARNGDTIVGIGQLSQPQVTAARGLGNSPLNDVGELAFRFTLLPIGSSTTVGAVGIWRRPPPSSSDAIFWNGFE